MRPLTGGKFTEVARDVVPTDRDRQHELQALKLALTPHKNNNDTRKFVTITLVVVWGVITIGISFGQAVPTEMYGLLSAFVGAWVSKLQEQEAKRLDDSQQ